MRRRDFFKFLGKGIGAVAAMPVLLGVEATEPEIEKVEGGTIGSPATVEVDWSEFEDNILEVHDYLRKHPPEITWTGDE